MTHSISVEHQIGAQPRWSGPDRAIAELAGRQHGVVARRQLLELGLGRRAIGRRVEQGRLHPLHRGVYLVGHPTASREARWLAAVLSGGMGALLSHQSAAALWGIRPTARTKIDVTIPAGRSSTARIQFHRSSVLPDERTIKEGIPVTTVARTLFDLAAELPQRAVERAINEAEVLHVWDEVSLDHLLARYPRRPGARAAREALAARREGATITRSDLEELFLSLLARESLPRPEVNAILSGHEVDFLWRERGLAVEVDGKAAHATAAAFESDRERDRVLQAAGWRVIRITWRQLERTPGKVAADLRCLLGTVSPCAH
jgi:very-short-patch-repair endonuclease